VFKIFHHFYKDKSCRRSDSSVLRQHAGLTKEVMLVGQFNKFELWDETTWYQRVKDEY
jgi:MraZ protein